MRETQVQNLAYNWHKQEKLDKYGGGKLHWAGMDKISH